MVVYISMRLSITSFMSNKFQKLQTSSGLIPEMIVVTLAALAKMTTYIHSIDCYSKMKKPIPNILGYEMYDMHFHLP